MHVQRDMVTYLKKVKMKKFKALMVWAAVVTATSASAQSSQGYYGEVGYLPLSIEAVVLLFPRS